MTQYSLDDIKKIVDELALKINAPTNLLPSYGQQTWDSHPYIEVDNLGFMFYIISERGQEYQRKMTDKIDDLLYWIFANVTFSKASEYELKNRIEDKDCRRIMFDKQEELLGQLNYNWRQKENAERQGILKNHPFDDLAGVRATYFGQLRQQGLSETEISKLAYEKYPNH
ncbi:hypothetical protein GZH53_06010 [Flavihumibacter sp. R14]|nr:hypothetical protein [Flavihumibacter soli]